MCSSRAYFKASSLWWKYKMSGEVHFPERWGFLQRLILFSSSPIPTLRRTIKIRTRIDFAQTKLRRSTAVSPILLSVSELFWMCYGHVCQVILTLSPNTPQVDGIDKGSIVWKVLQGPHIFAIDNKLFFQILYFEKESTYLAFDEFKNVGWRWL